MNHAADQYDEAMPGLGDEFLATVERGFDLILSAPQRWPFIDGRHHRYVVRRFPFSILLSLQRDRGDSETEVVFVAVANHKRRPGYWVGRR